MFYPNVVKIEITQREITVYYSKYMLSRKVFMLENAEANIMMIPGGRGSLTCGLRIFDKKYNVDIHTGDSGWSIEKLEDVATTINQMKNNLPEA